MKNPKNSKLPFTVQHGLLEKDLRYITLKNELESIWKEENLLTKRFSKLFHFKYLSSVSETASKSIFRPSAILGAGISSFIGSVSYYIYINVHKLKGNINVFILLFIFGYMLGLVIEAIFHSLYKYRQTD